MIEWSFGLGDYLGSFGVGLFLRCRGTQSFSGWRWFVCSICQDWTKHKQTIMPFDYILIEIPHQVTSVTDTMKRIAYTSFASDPMLPSTTLTAIPLDKTQDLARSPTQISKHNTTHAATQRIDQTQEPPRQNKMDSSLIHLIPNLLAANRKINTNAKTTPTSHQTNPTDPPPPYTPQQPHHPTTDNHKDQPKIDLPLKILLLGPSSKASPRRPIHDTHKDFIILTPSTDYWTFLGHVRPLLTKLAVDSGWEVAIVVELRGRSMWKSGGGDLEVVGEGDWRDVIAEVEGGRVRGLRVVCWRR